MLSQDQIAFFDRTGYLVVEDVLDQNLLDRVRAEYAARLDELLDDWGLAEALREASFEDKIIAAYQQGFDWFQPLDISLPGDRIEEDTPFHFGPAVFDMITAPRLLDMVQDLIGPEISSNPIQHVRIKPPAPDLRQDEVRAHITATDWHQDRAVALQEADDTKMITVWLAITDATPENGCLQVMPKAEDQAMLPHCPKTQTAIADGFVDEARAVPLPVKSGGAVIFDPMTPHSSLVNRTDGIRWSFDLRYHVTGQNSGRTHFPEFVARSDTNPEIVLTDWRVWRGLWEESRAHLAGVPHIDIHRWTSDAPYCA
ncbi:MAG: phytanoyl-CoA dioxygenase family protein [Paracoccaceae bacterium]